MRWVIFSVLMFSISILTVAAETPSPYVLVRGLRSAGMYEFAQQRLEEFKANPNLLPPDDRPLLDYEIARTNLEMASAETDDGRRAVLLNQARIGFETFRKNNPTNIRADEARVELAKLLVLEAKGALSKARRIENEEERAKALQKVREPFNNALKEYTEASKSLAKRLENPGNAKESEIADLKKSLLQAELGRAITIYDTALTYPPGEDPKARADTMTKAKNAFDNVIDKAKGTEVGYLAQVWYQRCRYELDERATEVVDKGTKKVNFLKDGPLEMLAKFEQENTRVPAAAPAIRLSRFFAIQHTLEEAGKDKKLTPDQVYASAERVAQDWLNRFPSFKNTPEGCGARYQLAVLREQRGKLLTKYDENTGRVKEMPQAAKAFYNEASKLYRELIETENEYTERSKRNRRRILLDMLEAEGKGDDPAPKSLKTLDAALLASEIQEGRLNRLVNEKRKTLEALVKAKGQNSAEVKAFLDMANKELQAEEKLRARKSVEYLEHAVSIITPKDSPREIFEVKLNLARILVNAGRPQQAALLAESLCRGYPKVSKALDAGSIAVEAYNRSIIQLNERKDEQSKEFRKSDIARLASLAEYVEKLWPNEPQTDDVRFKWAIYLMSEGNNVQAWEVFKRISPSFGSIYSARLNLGANMFTILRGTETETKDIVEGVAARLKENAVRFNETVKLLEELTPPPSDANPEVLRIYARCKVQLLQLLSLARQYDRIGPMADAVIKQIDELNIDAGVKTNLGYSVKAYKLNSVANRSIAMLAEKKFDEADTFLDADIKAIRAELDDPVKSMGDGSPEFRNYRSAQQAVIIKGIQAAVQKGNVERANNLLETLSKAGGSIEGNVAVMRNLVSSIRKQIDDLKEEKKDVDAKELALNFTEFLDRISANPSKLTPPLIYFLGQGYADVNQNAKAAEFYQKAMTNPPEGIYKLDEVFNKNKTGHGDRLKVLRDEVMKNPDTMKTDVKALVEKYESAKNKILKHYEELAGAEKAKQLAERAQEQANKQVEQLADSNDITVDQVPAFYAPMFTARTCFQSLESLIQPQTSYYNSCRLLRIRALRTGPPDLVKVALEELKEYVGDPLAKDKTGKPQPIIKDYYGSPDFRRELCFALEAAKLWGPAVQNWVRMTQEFVPGGLPAYPTPPVAPKIADSDPNKQEKMQAFAKKQDEFQLERPKILRKRAEYFDLFLEAQRCSAEAYKNQDATKFKGGIDAINTALENIGQRLFDLETKNEDFRDKDDLMDRLQKILKIHKKIEERYNTLKKTNAPKNK
jgi:hypothetical protein